MTPETMQVVTQRELGGPEVLELSTVAVPQPLPTEVRVKVAAAGINPVDWKTRQGKGMAAVIGPPPFSVGWDLAGTVDAVGMGVSRFAVGDRVFGMPFFPRQAAAYAEYVCAPARQLVAVPDGVDLVTAAAAPLAATTAWQIVHDVARVESGQRVLVTAAAGGVGHLVVQLAAALGAHVIGVDSGEKLDFLRTCGAAETVDYRTAEFDQLHRDVDVVVDFLGGQTSFRALTVLRPGGLVVSVPSGQGDGLDEAAAAAGVRAGRIIVEPDRVALEGVAAMLGAGTLTVKVDRTYPLVQVAQAHAAGERGETFGKLVLTVG